MINLSFILYLIILAFLHACIELEIEGKAKDSGWAKNLPTLRIYTFFEKVLGGKPLTGYHILMLLMTAILFHGIFLYNRWTFKLELQVWGLYSLYFVIEDFIWFLLHPHYRLKNFRKGKIRWHKRWFLFLPYSYWIGIIIGILFLILGGIK